MQHMNYSRFNNNKPQAFAGDKSKPNTILSDRFWSPSIDNDTPSDGLADSI
jgi:hypothetical protein